MADRVEVTESQHAATAATTAGLPTARGFEGELQIARVLRTGALLAGGCFLLSILLELVPAVPWLASWGEAQAQTIQGLRKAGVVMLIITPVVRLVAAGVMLGLRGEWRYSAYGAMVLVLLGVAVLLGFTH